MEKEDKRGEGKEEEREGRGKEERRKGRKQEAEEEGGRRRRGEKCVCKWVQVQALIKVEGNQHDPEGASCPGFGTLMYRLSISVNNVICC